LASDTHTTERVATALTKSLVSKLYAVHAAMNNIPAAPHTNNHSRIELCAPKHRVAKTADQLTSPAQCVAPLTCKLLAALEPHLVPPEFIPMHSNLPFVYVEPEFHAKEIVGILERFPRNICVVRSETLQSLVERLEGDALLAVQIYVLAYCVDHADALRAWKPHAPEPIRTLHLSLLHGIRLDAQCRDVAKTPMAAVLANLLLRELQDRTHVVFNLLDAPFYFPHADAFTLLGLAHFEPAFVRDLRKSVLPFVHGERQLDRAEELVRNDPDLFLCALRTVPPRFPASLRFERDVWDQDPPHPEAGRIMLAFASIWFIRTLRTIPWNLNPHELKRMYQLANRGWCPTMYEITSPFGSKT
jgi:hypothetical protein